MGVSYFVVGAPREQAFERLWRVEMPRIVTYAARHVGTADAHDVAAETFMVAWRRWDDITEPPFAWLLGVARNVVANHVRSLQRRRRLQDRVRLLTGITGRSGSHLDLTTRLDALGRLAALSETDREALLLTAWDGLTTQEAAAHLGISDAALRKRVSRARAAVALGASEPSDNAHVEERP
jgi:RNA polymerase sigma-70 factor (ECF subfamily)